jgi:type I restriction enzyme, S subunit
MCDFIEYSLRDIETKDGYGSVDGPFGSNLPASAYTEKGVPVIRGVNLSLGVERFKDYNYVFVSQATADQLIRSSCKPGDIIFTKKGTLGQTGLVPTDSEYKYFILSSNQMRLRVNKEIADPLYVYYFVSSTYSQNRILADSMTSGVPKINLGYIRNFRIILPSLDIQKIVVSVISAYDDLIENNKRRIALLEKMAEDIYREWFVRFRFPGYQTAEFEKGMPKGWEIKKLGEILTLSYGKALKIEERKDGEIPVYGSSGVVGFHDQPLVKRSGIIVGRKGNVGSVFWSAKEFFPIDTVYYVESNVSRYFLYYLLQTMNFINNDAAVPGLNRNQAYSNQVLFPGDKLIAEFETVVRPVLKQRQTLEEINNKLVATKEILLPRLISGKISVVDLDIQFPPNLKDEIVKTEKRVA